MLLSNIKNSHIQNDTCFWVSDSLDFTNSLNHILDLQQIPTSIFWFISVLKYVLLTLY